MQYNTGLLKEAIRFGFVGGIATAVHYITYWLLLLWLTYNIAYSIGYIASLFMNYILTTSFTFKTKRTKENGVGFVCCHLFNYLFQMGLLNLLIFIGCSQQLCPVIIFLIAAPTNFLLVRTVMKKFK